MGTVADGGDAGERCALIAGATGMVGARLGLHVSALAGWRAIGLARKPPAAPGFPMIEADLLSPKFSAEDRRRFCGVTDIFYTARYDHHVQVREPVRENLEMLRNLVDAVGSRAANLRHIHILQGTKYYGFDFGCGPFKTPAKESDGRAAHDSWYFAQEDFVAALQKGSSWTWSASRPHGVCDSIPGITRSLARVIAVFATVCRARSQPLTFPGRPGCFDAIYQCTDAALLARAIVWMATQPRCANQAFNVTNGDFIRWRNLWPTFAAYFGLEAGAVEPVSLARDMPRHRHPWESVVRTHGLQDVPIEQAALWPYADAIFGSEFDIMSDTTKLRQYGFCEFIDTEAMFVRLFDALRRARVVP